MGTFQENVYGEPRSVMRIHEALSNWHEQKDYPAASWDGVERFHWELAKVVEGCAVEVAGSYRYPSSTRDVDGADWRYVMPLPRRQGREAVAVNCHSLAHDDVWTLVTTTCSSDEIATDGLSVVAHPDPWVRSMLWSVELTKSLGDCERARRGMLMRLGWLPRLRSLIRRLKLPMMLVYEEMFGVPSCMPERLTVMVNGWRVRRGSIAAFFDCDPDFPYGVMAIATEAFDDWSYVSHVVTHEMIHACLGDAAEDEVGGHDAKFEAMAEAFGLPEELRD